MHPVQAGSLRTTDHTDHPAEPRSRPRALFPWLGSDRTRRLAAPLAVLFLALTGSLRAADPVITEFVAANATGLTDADGEFSDWIELHNPDQTARSLAGWHLTDDPDRTTLWTFPAVAIPPQGYLVVYASGKNRTDPAKELHASFKLDREGEFLALVQPDGRTITSVFEPAFPRQITDVAYGRAMANHQTRLVGSDAPGRLLVPADAGAGVAWTRPEFDDVSWTATVGGVGYDRPEAGSPDPADPPLKVEDVTRPTDFIVATSSNSPGNEGVGNAIDNSPATKYLNFDKLNAGLTVTPSVGPTLVTGLRLTSANDAPERDPTSYVLFGSQDGQTFSEIARGSIPTFSARFTPVQVNFANTQAWSHYRLLFPTVRNAAGAVAVQIAEIELLGTGSAATPEFGSLIRTDVDGVLYSRHPSAYLRLPFALEATPSSGRLTLRLRYEDGFVAYLNGTEVARGNVPAQPAWNSVAVTNRFRRDAATETRIDLTAHLARLRPGANLLALHGLNTRADSRDFLLAADLELNLVTLGGTGYLSQPTPGAVNPATTGGLVAEVGFSTPRGLPSAPFDLELRCATPGAEIRYTTNGTAPDLATGLVYTRPIAVARTAVIRARAFRPDWRPSPIATHSYLFLGDVATQDRAATLAAGFPATWNGRAADYGLDRRVVGPNGTDAYGGKYARSFEADLRSLPSVSLVMPIADLFGPQGIYANPESRGDAWERATSIEWLNPDGTPGFQADAGLRIQGGAFRRFDLSLKKSFRVVFRERYGPARLEHPVFGPEATGSFDNFVLRANSNDAWPYGDARAVYVRDAFAMEMARRLGIPSSHGRFVHLYINGFYWGLYNPVERPDAAFSAAYFGGDADTWDSINQDSAPDGTYDAWNRMLAVLNQGMANATNYHKLQGSFPDGTRNPAYEDLLEVDNYIDYLILNFYMGNVDWPGRNWWAGRDRAGTNGFTFRPWDTETALDFSGVSANVTGASDAVARPYAALRANAEFRLRFADHVQRHFFNGGALAVDPLNPAWNPLRPTNNPPAALFASLANGIRGGVVGESARWGDQLRSTPFTRDEHWQKACDSLLASYFPRRNPVVLGQFRAAGLYPRTEPPSIHPRGGTVPEGASVTLTAPAGSIYYTTDGSDPRRPGGGIAGLPYQGPLVLTNTTRLRVRALNGTEWSALDEARFRVGAPRLLLTELHYHPAPVTDAERALGFANADDFEFVELQNLDGASVDLAGLRFASGIAFEFADAADRLAPGEIALVVRSREAFEARYGTLLAPLVVGSYSGRLDNAGERVLLLDAQGRSVVDLTYGVRSPWPSAADGSGPSLELVDAGADPALPGSWRTSETSGGSPGRTDMPVLVLKLVPDPAQSGWFRLRFRTPPGQGYTVFVRDSLLTGEWRVREEGEPRPTATDRDVPIVPEAGVPVRFYRVSVP